MKIQSHDESGKHGARKYTMAQLTVDEFHGFWPQISSMMDKIPHTWTHWTKEYVQSAVEIGGLTAWCIGPPPDAILVFLTSIHLHPAQKVFCVEWAAGTFKKDMIPLIDATWTEFARIQDCTMVEVRGRIGWEPALKSVGFKREAVVWTRRMVDIRKH